MLPRSMEWCRKSFHVRNRRTIYNVSLLMTTVLPTERNMYETLQHKIYWNHMANRIFTTVSHFRECARNLVRKTQTRHLKLFPGTSTLQFIAIDKLGFLQKTTTGNKLVVITADRYFGRTQAVPISRARATHITSIFYDHWIVPYGTCCTY